MFIRIKRKNSSYSLDVCAPYSLSFSLRKKKGEKEKFVFSCLLLGTVLYQNKCDYISIYYI